MKRNHIAALVIAFQAIVLPSLSGSLAGPDRVLVIVFQVMLAILCIGIFVGTKTALWGALALAAVQVPVIESEHIAWHVSAGFSLSIGVLKSESWLDSRVGLNYFSGYVFNGAIFRAPMKRLLTDGQQVTGAFMLNLAVMPAAILLLRGRTTKVAKKASQAPEPMPVERLG